MGLCVFILGHALSVESEVARLSEQRAAAKVALLRGDVQEKLRKALRRAPGGEARAYEPGELVYFWSPTGVKPGVRYRRDAGAWRGPAVVLVPDGASRYFVSWRGRCLLVAAANLKGASLEESQDDLRLREAETDLAKGYVDLAQDSPPPGEPEAPPEPVAPGLAVRRRRAGFGRRMSEARKMMQGLKSVKRILQGPMDKKVPGQRGRRLREEPPPALEPRVPEGEAQLSVDGEEIASQAEEQRLTMSKTIRRTILLIRSGRMNLLKHWFLLKIWSQMLRSPFLMIHDLDVNVSWMIFLYSFGKEDRSTWKTWMRRRSRRSRPRSSRTTSLLQCRTPASSRRKKGVTNGFLETKFVNWQDCWTFP